MRVLVRATGLNERCMLVCYVTHKTHTIQNFSPVLIRDIVIAGLQANKTHNIHVTEVPGKGLGVVAGEDIEKNLFVCEYKYNLSYPRKEKAKWEQEYVTQFA